MRRIASELDDCAIPADLVKRARDLGAELGGRLEIPHFSWKWLAGGGRSGCQHAQEFARNARWSAARSVDRMLLRAQRS
jgi:hypothetical protein